MTSPKPTFRPHLSGGFSEEIGESDTAQAQVAQSAAFQQQLAQQQPGAISQQPSQAETPVREISTLTDEGKRAVTDVGAGLKTFLDPAPLREMFGLPPATDPARLKKEGEILGKFNQLTDEEKGWAREKFRQRQKAMEQQQAEQEARHQREQAAQNNSLPMPTSVAKGPVGPGAGKSKKSSAVARLQQQRQAGPGGPQQQH